MATYFADTSYWMALTRKRDQYHQRAFAWNQFLMQTGGIIVTTEAVLWEWLNGFSRASTRTIAAEGYLQAHSSSRIVVTPFHSQAINSAVQMYRTRPDKNWSLTDCFSFMVMEQRRLSDALTTDRHFEQAGMKALMLREPPKQI